MLTIRKLLPSDELLAVSKIYTESWRYAYKNILSMQYLDSLSDGDWIGNLSKSGRHVWVAELDGKLIGTASYGESRTPEYKGQGEIYSIYFLPEYIGKGYGERLMSAVLSELKALDYKSTFLWVLEDNIAARRFYEKTGFVCSGEVKEAEIGGKTLREVKYIIHIEEQ